MSKQFLGVVAAILLLFVGIFYSSTHKTAQKASGNTSAATQHIEGNLNSSVKLVEYGDFQCPFCEQYHPTLQTVVATYKDQISFQFRNFPLVNAHPNAFAAARAAEAAAIQGKYWEMHDTLYSAANWQSWTPSNAPSDLFNGYAQQLGLNLDQFKKDYASSKVNDAINADMAAGTALDITGTPTFFINGKKVQIANTVEAFQKVLDAELKKVKSSEKTTSTTQSTPAPSASDTTPAAQ